MSTRRARRRRSASRARRGHPPAVPRRSRRGTGSLPSHPNLAPVGVRGAWRRSGATYRSAMTVVRRLSSDELSAGQMASLRALFDAAWPEADDAFTDDDFAHAFGGVHLVVEEDGGIVSHASVVERRLHTGGHPLATGYVEAGAAPPT